MNLNFRKRTLVRWALWNIGLLAPETQTTTSERQCLARYAAGRRRLAEIGVYNGVTTLVLRRVMASEGVLYAVDPFPSGKLGFNIDELIARHTVNQSTNGAVEFVKMTGAEAAKRHIEMRFPPIDFIFIDGDHSWSGIHADWTNWSPLLMTHGIVALHDSRSYPGREVTLDSAATQQK